MGHHDGSPKLPDLTQKGEPLAPSFPQATRPMAPFMSISPFIHEALLHHLKDRGSPDGNMAGSHLVSQDPPMLPPAPGTSACLTPVTPFPLPQSLCMFTVCHLGGLNALHAKDSQRSLAMAGPLPCLLFLWVRGWGSRGSKAICSPFQL